MKQIDEYSKFLCKKNKVPLPMISTMKGYMFCEECGEPFGIDKIEKYIDHYKKGHKKETLADLVNNMVSRVKALEHKIIVLGQTDWFQGIDDEILSIKWLAEQIERASKGKPLKK